MMNPRSSVRSWSSSPETTADSLEPCPIPSVYDLFPLPLGNSVYICVIKIRPDIRPIHPDVIVCEIHILDVDKGMLYDLDTASLIPGKIKYAALSYTWGNETAPRAVEIDGRVIPTRRNLWKFFDRVRVDTLLGNQEYYWIDALCIDQSTVGERIHQVSLMGKIYAQAC